MYGSDAVVRGDWGVVKTPPKSGRLFELHADTLSFIGIDKKESVSVYIVPPPPVFPIPPYTLCTVVVQYSAGHSG